MTIILLTLIMTMIKRVCMYVEDTYICIKQHLY